MQKILDRQLRSLALSAAEPPDAAQWAAFLERVRRTYTEFQQDRYTIERSLELTSREMLALNASLREASARQRAAHERLQAVVGALSDGLGALNADGTLALLNTAGEQLLGAGSEELLGSHVLHRFELHVREGDHLWPAEEPELLVRLARGDALRDEQGTMKTADGRLVPVDVVLNPVVENGAVVGAVLLFRDVSEQRKADEELRRARREAEAANRAKGEFLAVMSHEIRTPMNAVIGMAGLLLETQLTDEQRDHAETVRRSGEALLAVINDILDFSKVESGRLDLEEIDYDLLATLDDLSAIFRDAASRKDIDLVVWAAPDVPTRVRGDPSRLRQILVNLVGNALKFTAEGEVCVRATLVPGAPAGQHTLRFEVRDSGVGIPRDAQRALFRPFSQADSSTTRRYGGTGLGLAICHRLAALMGGDIGVESEAGRGSLFWFTVRVRAPVEAAPAMNPTPLASRRLLVVDGGRSNRRLIEELCTHAGAHVDAVADADAAFALLRAPGVRPWDALLVDVKVSDIDRSALAREVCRLAAPADPAVVLLGGRGRGRTLSGLYAGGFRKPLRAGQLCARLAAMLAGEGGPATRTSMPPAYSVSPADDFNGARVLVVEDNAVNQKVITRMLQRYGLDVDLAGNGREALDAAARAHYAVIFMDCQMPELDGYEATRLLRESEASRGARTPVVAMTAHALQGDRDRCIDAGMDDYLSKPLTAAPLLAALRRWIPRDR